MSQEVGAISALGTMMTFFFSRGACSGTLCHVLDRALGRSRAVEEDAAMPLAGGILGHGYQCGMIWGATLAAGAEAYRLLGAGPQGEAGAIVSAGRLLESFRARNGHVNCLEITELDASSSTLQLVVFFLLKGGSVRCALRAAQFAPAARDEIRAAFAGDPSEAPPAPVSCSALLARRMGVSDMHGVMAAGFAGGIGLSGGACGALAAAIWIMAMKRLEAGADRLGFKDPAMLGTIDRFLECTDHEFECARIVGRKFDGIADHADHVRAGGCARILEVLAAT
jgi:hypothetical protein